MDKKQVLKKRMTKKERVSQIVNVASMLFANKGFKGTTTREIARKAGISEAVIFKYFSKKVALYSAIIDLKCNDTAGQSRLMKTLEGKIGRDVFRQVASFLITEHQKDPSFMRLLMYSALEGHNLSDIFIKTKGMELIEFLAGQIRGLIKNKVFREIDPVIAARSFMGMVLHYSLAQEIYGLKKYFKTPNKNVIETFIKIFFEGMTRR
ncbi:MAG: hypothetical protein A2073_06880 [Deltaproteobacteria bacterium GWC2_42_11]|nr:MAG: hypothetical protein A2073_06880 [Deltaproteobacteria bacterium GWC2_42_11]HBO85202.1 hypothetical protein [Deltaproteobacteria bacterium]